MPDFVYLFVDDIICILPKIKSGPIYFDLRNSKLKSKVIVYKK